MKSVFDKNNLDEITRRIESLRPDSVRQWGKMDVAQMMAHCSHPLEQATGKSPAKNESNFFTRVVIRWFVLRMVKQGSFARNAPTSPSFVIADKRAFDAEKTRLLQNLRDFYAKGQQGELGAHPSFGKFDNQQWGSITYVHLDHHLKQFSA